MKVPTWVYSIADQGFSSASSLFVSVLAARSLSQEGFADFSICLNWMIFITLATSSVFISPMLSSYYGISGDGRTGYVLSYRSSLSSFASLGIMLLVVSGFSHGIFGKVFLILGWSLCRASGEQQRAIEIAQQNHKHACGLSFLHFLSSLLGLIGVLSIHGKVSSGVIIAAGALPVGLAVLISAGCIHSIVRFKSNLGEALKVIVRHKSLSGLALMSSCINASMVVLSLHILEKYHGSQEVAIYQALATLTGMANPAIQGISRYANARMADSYNQGDVLGFNSARQGGLLLCAGFCGAFSGFFLFAANNLGLIFGHSYAQAGLTALTAMLFFTLNLLGLFYQTALFSIGRARAITLSRIFSSFLVVPLACKFAIDFGHLGVFAGISLGYLIQIIVSFFVLRCEIPVRHDVPRGLRGEGFL